MARVFFHRAGYRVRSSVSSALRAGENTFTISSDTEHHMLEVQWPGPALTVRFRSNATR